MRDLEKLLTNVEDNSRDNEYHITNVKLWVDSWREYFRKSTPGTAQQITPTQNDHPAVWDMVMEDIKERDQKGIQTYGTRLQPFNGRDALVDAYQEALDLVVYLRQAIYERDTK